MSLTLSRGDAVAVLVGIGYRNITDKKWNNEKLAKQLANLKNEDAIAPDLELDDQDADMTLRDVLAAIEDETEIHVTDNGKAPELPAADGGVLTPMDEDIGQEVDAVDDESDVPVDEEDDGTMVGEKEEAEDAKAADDAAVVKAEAKAVKAKAKQEEKAAKAAVRTASREAKAKEKADEKEVKAKARADKKAEKDEAAAEKKADKKLSLIDAAAKVLEEEGRPMKCAEMIELAKKKNYWMPGKGKTPVATLVASIGTSIKNEKGRFKKTDKATYDLV